MIRKSGDPENLLHWLGYRGQVDFSQSRTFGSFVGFLVLLLFLLAVASAFVTLARSFFSTGQSSSGLGAGAIVVALVSAPFVIWRTFIAHRGVNFQKEGHITDRISKAVEQLGAEKTVDRIGRVVEILPEKIGPQVAEERLMADDGARPSFREHSPSRQSIIQWQGGRETAQGSRMVNTPGEWKVFSESLPNIEVRVGAVLSLERIAQDSSSYDNGRDHIRVMEIIAAYIRHNTRAIAAMADVTGTSEAKLRIDLQTALDVIGRRSPAQKEIEKASRFRINLQDCDFSGASFQYGDFSAIFFRGSRFNAGSFRGADLTAADMTRCMFVDCDFQSGTLRGTRMDLSRMVYNRNDTESACGPMSAKQIVGVSIAGADWESVAIDAERFDEFFATQDTKIKNPDDIPWKMIEAAPLGRSAVETEIGIEASSLRLGELSGPYWILLSSLNMLVQREREAFWKDKGINSWPYND